MENKYDLIVIGCGFCGSVIARLAADLGKRVLILERRNHIAGNMYDEYDENGILIQKYGPHVFHTDEDWIINFISRFSEWDPFKLHYGVELDERYIPAPFGYKAIDLLYSKEDADELKHLLKTNYPNQDSIPILDLMENSNEKIAEFSHMLYEKNYKPYAAKQWSLAPEKLDRSVIGRMPVILSDRTYYFDTKYEMIPRKGFTQFFQNMLCDPRIEIRLNTDASSVLSFDVTAGNCIMAGEKVTAPVVYTGPLEELFPDQKMTLPYRSLYFDYKTFEKSSYQPMTLVTYPTTHDYIRTTEFIKLMPNKPNVNKTVVAFEYSVPYNREADCGNEPYYPILTEENIAKNDSCNQKLKNIENVFPCGRLADYKYYNMDQVIIRAFDVFFEIRKKYWQEYS